MTTLICWAGFDSRGQSSLYLAADSQFSWESGEQWLEGRKVFTSKALPILLGYYGDVVFASQSLSHAIEQIEIGSLFTQNDIDARTADLVEFLKARQSGYPTSQRRGFGVLLAEREDTGMAARFNLGEISWTPSSGWNHHVHTAAQCSGVVCALGTGATTFKKFDRAWRNSDVGRTSRAVFSAFFDHVVSGEDGGTGGVPQVVRLYREGPGTSVGVVQNGGAYLSGIPLSAPIDPSMEFRDRLFQRCDSSGTLLKDAQPHARPRM